MEVGKEIGLSLPWIVFGCICRDAGPPSIDPRIEVISKGWWQVCKYPILLSIKYRLKLICVRPANYSIIHSRSDILDKTIQGRSPLICQYLISFHIGLMSRCKSL